ncbi:L-threonylcarbamoyladenylate synthase [Candidatus Phycosocius spiralis]|uniref:Threonylcarbamoyl-AMP synthase n=1 Tax=Candidatus Phycosocius spiralis TaxID=2815099 RepID=A0ABQ4PYT5_9PROT|nr:L-threonylcarbamoyladenylate synthase [Candidatus Phycosocius spiralis]GIU67848.1 threonylcarbamoyl-AMP synthase [Candidatus Phycosocius spiralis]
MTRACAALEAGQLVGMPTETVYGLAGDATNSLAIAAIYAAKGRPRFNPLISHVSNLDAAKHLGYFAPLAEKLALAFWPGPLSLVVPRLPRSSVCDLACAGLDTIALRVPAHPLAQALLTQFGKPIGAPSANQSGRPSPTLARHVREEMGDAIAMVLDGGPCSVGLESAVIAVDGERATLLRLGGIARADLEAVAGPLLNPKDEAFAAPASPGMLLRHYAPNARLRLSADTARDGEILIGFGPNFPAGSFNLSPTGNITEAAANLFAILRLADAQNPTAIAVAPIPNWGLGEAIIERLTRASAQDSS